MVTFAREGNGLTVSGELAAEDMDEFVRRGMELVQSDAPQVLLDIRQAEDQGSSFIGAVAEVGAAARSSSKRLIVRAEGRLADLLVWAGLHRVVTLYVAGSDVGTPAGR